MRDLDALTAAVQRAIPPGSDLWCETKARSILKTLDAAGYQLFTVDSLAAALQANGLGHWSWRCEYPNKGEPPCDFTEEAAAIIMAAKEAERE